MDNTFICKNEEGYFIDKTGKPISDSVYEYGVYLNENLRLIRTPDRCEIIDSVGKTVHAIDRIFASFIHQQSVENDVFISHILPQMHAAARRNSQEKINLYKTGFVYVVNLKTNKELFLSSYVWNDAFVNNRARVAYKRRLQEDEYIAATIDDAKWGFIDINGKLCIDTVYSDAQNFSENLAAVKKEHWYYIDADGKTCIPGPFQYAENFNNGLAIVQVDSKFGLIDTRGKWVMPPSYEYIAYSGNKMYTVFQRATLTQYQERCYLDKGYGALASVDGTPQTEFEYSAILSLRGRGYILQRDSSFWISDPAMQHKIPLPITEVFSIGQERVVVKVGEKMGIVDFDGHWIIEPAYDYIAPYVEER